MPNRLWAFRYDYTTSAEVGTRIQSETPLLVPPTTDGYTSRSEIIDAVNQNIFTINVARDFPWTYSKPGDVARAETPKIYLKEKRLKTNAFISSIFYSFANTKEGVNNLIQTLKEYNIGTGDNGFIKTLERLIQGAQNTALQGIGSFIENPPNTPTNENTAVDRQQGQNIIDSIREFFNKQAGDDNPLFSNKLLKAYQNLYPAVNTGWKYVFPYFDDYYSSSQNLFGDDTGNMALNVIKAGSETLQNIAGLAGALAHPFGFSFQEKAKFYNYPSEGEEFSFTFPLINSGSTTFDEVVRNWQLLFLLLYQNKPARIDRNVIEPPVFYEVSIPGQKFYPFCYVTNIQVDFKGSRRELQFKLDYQNLNTNETTVNSVGGENSSTTVRDMYSTSQQIPNFRTIIPDAYMVKITLKSLVVESRNFMAYSVLGGQEGTNALASVTDLDSLAAAARSYLGNSGLFPGGTGMQPGAGSPINYVGGWPDPAGSGQFIVPEISSPSQR